MLLMDGLGVDGMRQSEIGRLVGIGMFIRFIPGTCTIYFL